MFEETIERMVLYQRNYLACLLLQVSFVVEPGLSLIVLYLVQA